MSKRIVRPEFCQFGLHNFDNLAESTPRNTGSETINLCDICFAFLNQESSKGVDFTMEIIYKWAEERGSVPNLPNSISKPSDQAKACYCLNRILATARNTNRIFPIILNKAEERENFIQIVEDDANITQILHDTSEKRVISNIGLRLLAGCLDASKTTRETAMKEGEEILIPPDHRSGIDQTIRQKSSRDIIYKAGVEAALFFELIENKHPNRHLEGIPVDSPIRRYLRQHSKNKSIVIREDLLEPCGVS